MESYKLQIFSMLILVVIALTLSSVTSLLRLFFRFVLNVFFRDIKVRGSYNIPPKGPVIFAVAPHANQFVDPCMLLVSCNRRNLGFLIAKKSMDRFWIGLFARAFNSIPVVRPQDLTVAGSGVILPAEDTKLTRQSLNNEGNYELRGRDTSFTTQIHPRSHISLKGESVEVVKIISDTLVYTKKPFVSDAALMLMNAINEDGNIGSGFKITPHVNQSEMFSEVVSRLHLGQCVGIFPEGIFVVIRWIS